MIERVQEWIEMRRLARQERSLERAVNALFRELGRMRTRDAQELLHDARRLGVVS